MVLRTGAGPSAYPFQIGRVYLVFAAPSAESSVLEVDVCSPTRESELARAEMSQLDKRMETYTPK